MLVQLEHIQVIVDKTNAADLSLLDGVFAILISVNWTKKNRKPIPIPQTLSKTGKQRRNKGNNSTASL